MENKEKFVDFFKFCKTCKHQRKSEEDDPCWECLKHPVNVNSRKPTEWEDKDS
jgi:hypothetical protein